MKINLDQRLLLECLKTVSRAVSTNNTLPVLGNILIKAEGKHLRFAATNLEMSIQTSCEAAVKNEGAITVPAKVLTSYVSLLSSEHEVTLTATGDMGLEVKSGRSKTKIKGIAESEFPTLPDAATGTAITLAPADFRSAVAEVAFAAQENASRPVLGGVFIVCEGNEMKMVATDSYRLSERKIALKEKTEAQCLVPVRAIREGDRMAAKAETLTLRVTENQIAITTGPTTLTSRLIEGQFPNYGAIIPQAHQTRVHTNRGELELAIRRLSIFAKQNNQHMKLDVLADGLRVSSDATEVGEDETVLSATIEGQENVIALNAEYLQDVLSSLSGTDEIVVELQEKMNPAVIKPKGREDYLHLIMPLKI